MAKHSQQFIKISTRMSMVFNLVETKSAWNFNKVWDAKFSKGFHSSSHFLIFIFHSWIVWSESYLNICIHILYLLLLTNIFVYHLGLEECRSMRPKRIMNTDLSTMMILYFHWTKISSLIFDIIIFFSILRLSVYLPSLSRSQYRNSVMVAFSIPTICHACAVVIMKWYTQLFAFQVRRFQFTIMITLRKSCGFDNQ